LHPAPTFGGPHNLTYVASTRRSRSSRSSVVLPGAEVAGMTGAPQVGRPGCCLGGEHCVIEAHRKQHHCAAAVLLRTPSRPPLLPRCWRWRLPTAPDHSHVAETRDSAGEGCEAARRAQWRDDTPVIVVIRALPEAAGLSHHSANSRSVRASGSLTCRVSKAAPPICGSVAPTGSPARSASRCASCFPKPAEPEPKGKAAPRLCRQI
jgi:hypothetical protein